MKTFLSSFYEIVKGCSTPEEQEFYLLEIQKEVPTIANYLRNSWYPAAYKRLMEELLIRFLPEEIREDFINIREVCKAPVVPNRNPMPGIEPFFRTSKGFVHRAE